MKLKRFTIIALLSLATFACNQAPAPSSTASPAAQSVTPAASATSAPEAEAREVKPIDPIKISFRIGEEESVAEVPGLMVQVTDNDSDFFRFDFFATAENVQKIAESQGLTASYDAEAKTLTVGESTFEQVDVPPIGEGMDGSLAGFGTEGVDTYVKDGTPYFRISSVTKGFGSNSVSKMSSGLSLSQPE